MHQCVCINGKSHKFLSLWLFLQLPGQDSNLDKENQNAFPAHHNCRAGNTSSQDEERFAHGFAQTGQKQPLDGPALTSQIDPDLARVLDAWPTLPEPIRRASWHSLRAPENC